MKAKFEMNDSLFSENDLHQIKEKSISSEKVLKQIDTFKKGFPFTRLDRACTINDGITVITESEFTFFCAAHKEGENSSRLLKFVPASGAATRMFKILQSFDNDFENISKKDIFEKVKEGKTDYQELYKFIIGLREFAFFDNLKKVMAKNNFDIEEQIQTGEYKNIINFLLTEKGLNYANLPKGLLKFHRYDDSVRTPFEEHLVEGAVYTSDNNKNVKMHFTISPEHEVLVKTHIENVKLKYEKEFGVNYEITYSVQKNSTNTIAVDINNEPFRDKNGRLVFRPAGHGALIENLNELEGDIIFIKNIDNVVPDRLKELTYLYKKLVSGYLLNIQENIFKYLNIIETKDLNEIQIRQIFDFMKNNLYIPEPENFEDLTPLEKIHFAFKKLNRPIRVCGMVKNTGEPGGGPFWVKHDDNSVSLQLVETSQIDTQEPEQKNILMSSTHFSPVDLVCGVRDYKGKPFDLRKYVDPNTGFISIKSKDGRDLKALELPGLWNGAMADWNTIFVEVPLITFNPVKTINDLLRKEHQPL